MKPLAEVDIIPNRQPLKGRLLDKNGKMQGQRGTEGRQTGELAKKVKTVLQKMEKLPIRRIWPLMKLKSGKPG